MKPPSNRPNLRDQQRVEATLEVTVRRPTGETITCHSTNVSRAGMMIACNGDIMNRLIPGKRSPGAGEGIEVLASFSLPVVAAQKVAVAADCQVVHIRRIARDTFHIGIQFCDFEGNGYDYVDQYVTRQLTGPI